MDINSTDNYAAVSGTEGNDSITVYGNHSTLQAIRRRRFYFRERRAA
ncbi:MAG: hypothetical protein IJS81_01500 [Selenomonadaceae bacterium]|nr:hypothetical protein [Selenomonadaceae bacterium]